MTLNQKTRPAMLKPKGARGGPVVALVMAVVMAFSPSVSAIADVKGSMDNFWAGSLGAANVTGPGSFNGQKQGNYTLGNLSMRVPQETASLGSVQLPQVKAGCGGIDIFAGSFSFINSDQMVATAKAVASNAMGYAFQLALASLCPTCAQKIEQLQDQLNKLTQNQINSCQTAQALVGGIAGKLSSQMDSVCAAVSSVKGQYTDRVAARNACAQNRQSVTNSWTAAEKDNLPIDKNLAWVAMKKHPMLMSDPQLMEMVMTLTGTVIYRSGGSDNANQFQVLAAEGADQGVLSKLLDGGALKVHDCDENTNCLNPTSHGQTITIDTSGTAMKARVEVMLSSIVRKINNRSGTLTAQEQDFLNMAGAPVYKMASVYTALEGVSAESQMLSYADVIAIDLVFNWIHQMVNEVEAGARNMPAGVQREQVNEWLESVARVETQLSAKRSELAQKVQAIDSMVERTQAAESVLAARASTRLGTVLQFSSNLQPR